MNFKLLLTAFFTLLLATFGVSLLPKNFFEGKTWDQANEEVLSRYYTRTRMDETNKTMVYYKDNNIKQDFIMPAESYDIENITSTAEKCMDSLDKSNKPASIYEFYRDINNYNFVNNKKCQDFQSIWRKERSPIECYETIDLGFISNIRISVTTLADPNIYSIMEKFMLGRVEATRSILKSKGLDAENVLRDRPVTYLYLLLESIRSVYPEGVFTPTKMAMKKVDKLINGNLPLFKLSREKNSLTHYVDILFLIKTYDKKDVKDIHDMGITMFSSNRNRLDNEDLVFFPVWENANPLFRVCNSEGESLNE